MKKIAVIGAGIFGSEIAIRLAANGFHVSLFEVKENILLGATPHSVLRLHLGFHYPRDLETAVQSRVGFKEFFDRFPTSIDQNFRNYYALAKNNSRVNQNQFSEFVKAAGLDLLEIPKEVLSDSGFATHLVDAIYSNQEAVIDVDLLRNLLLVDLVNHGVVKNFNTEIVRARFASGKWIITDNVGREYDFDFVIRSTYGHDRMQISDEGSPESRIYEYHKTLVLDAELNIPRIGMTIIDGDFLTVLPKAHQNGYLVYAPVPSVIHRYIGGEYPKVWDDLDEKSLNLGENAIIERYKEWFGIEREFHLKKRLQTVRAIDSNVGKTDRRVSQVTLRARNFLDVNSGKIDHCVQIANQIVDIVSVN